MVGRDLTLPKRPSAIVFDLDGVLVDSTEVVELAWRRWADEQCVSIDDLLAVAHGRPAREVVQAFAPHLDGDHESKRLDAWEVEASGGLAAMPGAEKCVAAAARGPWAIVTSGAWELATGRLRAVGLALPPVLVTADDITMGKPHPQPYLRACEKLAIPASECLVIEDAPAGITAAKRAGMTVVAVKTTHAAAALQEADVVLESMHDVHERLSEIDR
jgi:mannitol-1-/sugar-/sorbitol-6-phosphatase